MKRGVEVEPDDELRSEYDFAQMKGGIRGKYVERYRAEVRKLKQQRVRVPVA